MKRSEINRYIREAKAFMTKYPFMLPPWADWTPDDWKTKGPECDDIRERAMGWDLTDFGWGDFLKIGLTLVTLRNGSLQKKDKPYCEKIMFVRCGQVTPTHFHWLKTEDIINRGGGILCMRLWKADKETEMLTEEPLVVSIDGVSTRSSRRNGASCSRTKHLLRALSLPYFLGRGRPLPGRRSLHGER